MLLKLFRGTGPGEVILILFTTCILWFNSFFNPAPPGSLYYDINPMPLYGLLKYLVGGNIFYGLFFIFSLVLLMLFLVSNFNTSHFFINERTFLPSVIYVLVTGLFPNYQLLNPVLPASVFLIVAIRRIVDSYRKAGTAYSFFDASLLIGTGSLFYANLIWFAILIFIGIAIFRTGNIRELLVSIIGLITPAVTTCGVYYITDRDISSLKDVLLFNLFSAYGRYSFSIISIIGIILVGIVILISMVHLITLLNNKKIKSRKTFTTLIWSLVISLTVYFGVPSASVEIIWMAAIPVSYIIAHYLIFSRNRILSRICFGIMFLVALFIQCWNLIRF
jgi:hypothetical protein